MADYKNGHWYTDENGNHYFVENGQTPKEGWEKSKRRKKTASIVKSVADCQSRRQSKLSAHQSRG